MNRCPSERPKRDEWHERDHNLEDAATVTGLTISCESWYRAPHDIGCWLGSECAFFYHQLHHQRCWVSPDFPKLGELTYLAGRPKGDDIEDQSNEARACARIRTAVVRRVSKIDI